MRFMEEDVDATSCSLLRRFLIPSGLPVLFRKMMQQIEIERFSSFLPLTILPSSRRMSLTRQQQQQQ